MNEKRNGALDRYPIEKKRAGRPSVTVKEDGAVIFYLYAPAAKIVQVAGLGGYFTNKKINLMPDGQGGFFAEVQDFHWGMHYYFWYVDGVRICNPYAGISYGCFAAINTFEVQEKNVDFYFAKDIPHGTVSICKYASKVSSHLKECYVYTPYGYEEGDERYPVLRRRERDRMDLAGEDELYHGLSDRRGKVRENDRGHEQWLCLQRWRKTCILPWKF